MKITSLNIYNLQEKLLEEQEKLLEQQQKEIHELKKLNTQLVTQKGGVINNITGNGKQYNNNITLQMIMVNDLYKTDMSFLSSLDW